MNVTTEHNLNKDLLITLNGLIANWENNVIEFNESGKDYDNEKIGKYFSALSNEANLRGLQYAWLVFGVNKKTKGIIGTDYRMTKSLDSLKHEIAQNSTDGITFTDIYEVYNGTGNDAIRVVMFKIPATVAGLPTAWKNTWYRREGESLGTLSMEEVDLLRSKSSNDWSKQIIKDSSLRHLDTKAIKLARQNFMSKKTNNYLRAEMDQMSDEEFLTKLKLVVDSKLTNAAMVLLGNPDYDYIMDTIARIMWRLYDSKKMVKDYWEFNIPFITVVDKVFSQVRNLTYRYRPNKLTVFPIETLQYDPSLFRQLLNNCIAHQEYTIGGRIYLDEYEDSIVISNPGRFLPGNIEAVLKVGYTPPYYRNQLLSEAMAKFNLIDTAQMGIRKVFNIQRNRYFPMPDYAFETPPKVAVTVYGQVIDENTMRLLFDRPSLDIEDVFLIDKVQKKLPFSKKQVKRLRDLNIIKGKMPNIFVSSSSTKTIVQKNSILRFQA